MEETALAIIKAAKDKQVTSNYTGRLESNPATPPLVQGFSIQVLLFPDPSVLYTPPVREEEDLGFDSYYSDVAPARVHNSPSDTRVDTARIKSIIVSPLMETEEVHPRVQETALVWEKEETLMELRNKKKRKVVNPSKARSPRNSPNILKGASFKKGRLSQIHNSPSQRRKNLTGNSSRGQAKSTSSKKATCPSTPSTNPPFQLIPTMSKRSSDFRFPPTRAS